MHCIAKHDPFSSLVITVATHNFHNYNTYCTLLAFKNTKKDETNVNALRTREGVMNSRVLKKRTPRGMAWIFNSAIW